MTLEENYLNGLMKKEQSGILKNHLAILQKIPKIQKKIMIHKNYLFPKENSF